jgi:hypothetical protein
MSKFRPTVPESISIVPRSTTRQVAFMKQAWLPCGRLDDRALRVLDDAPQRLGQQRQQHAARVARMAAPAEPPVPRFRTAPAFPAASTHRRGSGGIGGAEGVTQKSLAPAAHRQATHAVQAG